MGLDRSSLSGLENDVSMAAIPGTNPAMNGYDVISVADDEGIGTVVREEGDYVVFEHGLLRKRYHAIPMTTVEVDAERRQVRTSLSKALIEDSPPVEDDRLDTDALARHYGRPDTSEEAVHERLATREGVDGERPGGIPEESPGMLGERYSSADVPEDR
jgi:hypothetical protein